MCVDKYEMGVYRLEYVLALLSACLHYKVCMHVQYELRINSLQSCELNLKWKLTSIMDCKAIIQQ